MENDWRIDSYIDKNCSHCNQSFTPEHLTLQRLKIIKKWYVALSSCYVDEIRRNQEKGIFSFSNPNWEGKWHDQYKEFVKEYEAELRELGFLH